MAGERLAKGRLDAVRMVALASNRDDRGVLTVIEGGEDLGFDVRRVYILHHLTGERGGHAHMDTQQLIIPVHGSCELTLSDGTDSRHFVLDDPSSGVLLGPMLFIRLYNFSSDARVVVLASTHYDKSRTIRTWEEYLRAIGS